MSDAEKPLWYRRLPESERVEIDTLRQAGIGVDNHFACGSGNQIRVSVLWSNRAEHFHVTNLAIRGPIPAPVLPHLVAFSRLQKLSHSGVSPEIVAEMSKRRPKCEIVEVTERE